MFSGNKLLHRDNFSYCFLLLESTFLPCCSFFPFYKPHQCTSQFYSFSYIQPWLTLSAYFNSYTLSIHIFLEIWMVPWPNRQICTSIPTNNFTLVYQQIVVKVTTSSDILPYNPPKPTTISVSSPLLEKYPPPPYSFALTTTNYEPVLPSYLQFTFLADFHGPTKTISAPSCIHNDLSISSGC